MEYLKKYFLIIILLIISVIIVVLFWGTGRLFVLISAIVASAGYYLLINAKEAGNNLKDFINLDNDEIREGFVKIEGYIETNDTLKSYIQEDNVVFYDVVVEKGKFDYADLNSYGSNVQPDIINNKFKNAKWSVITRKSEWVDFYVKNNNYKILVKNPERAVGKWVYKEGELPQMSIRPLNEAENKIKSLVENSKVNIEKGRYIRYMERTINQGEKIIVYGTLRKNENDKTEYQISEDKHGIFMITNDESYDMAYEERKNYFRGMVIFILGLIGMVISFLWPIITENAFNTQL